MSCGAVVPAAGSGSRFGFEDKTMRQVAGQSVLAWVCGALMSASAIDRIVIVVSEDNQFQVFDLIEELRSPLRMTTILGGATRTESVRIGVEVFGEETRHVLVHDAARPMVTPRLIRDAIAAGSEYGAAIPAIPVTDTIKQVDGDQVTRTLTRSELVAVQTPQVFRRDWLLAAYDALDDETDATDEASILERAGYPVRIIPGDPENIKVTTQTDALVAEAVLRMREGKV